MKFDAHESSLEGFVNTTKKLFQRSNGYVATGYIEFQPAEVANSHVEYFRRETSLARSNNPAASHTRAPARTVYLKTEPLDESPVSEGHEGGGDEHQACAHCGNLGHTVALCAVPTYNDGAIHACPVCNTRDHELDGCERMAAGDPNDSGFMHRVLECVLFSRGNKPRIHTTKWSWPDVLAKCDNLGLVTDRDKVLAWPWRDAFAVSIAQSSKTASFLEGSKHPVDFDPRKDNPDDLPPDPLFFNKSVKEILTMREKGYLFGDSFVPADEHAALDAPDSIAHLVQEAMAAVGAFDAQNRLKSRTDVGADLRKVKTETIDDGTVPTVARFSNVRAFAAIRTGAFPDECTILSDERSRGPDPSQPPGAVRDKVLAKVRKFYLEPYRRFDVGDPVFKRLYQTHTAAGEQSDPVADLEADLADTAR
jgi:hypothetical protein